MKTETKEGNNVHSHMPQNKRFTIEQILQLWQSKKCRTLSKLLFTNKKYAFT